jgi:hypothetical protein
MTKLSNCWKPSVNCMATTWRDKLHAGVNALKTIQREAISSMSTSKKEKRTCRACNQTFPLDAFKTKGDALSKGGGKYRQTICRTCSNEQFNAWVKRRRDHLRDAVYAGYGGVCACCGEWREPFLTIDHVNNDGYLDRAQVRHAASYSMYRQIIRDNFPPRYQILCYKCNCGRHRNGGICPHVDPYWCSTAIPSGSTAQAYGVGNESLLPITYGC